MSQASGTVLQYGAVFTCGLLFAGESVPHTFYAYDARQANGASGGHRFVHDLQVSVDSPHLQVLRDGQQAWLDPDKVNQLQVMSPEEAAVPVSLALGPLRFVDLVQVEALPNALPQARILQAEVWRLLNAQALNTLPLRFQVEATDPDPQAMGGIRQVGVRIEGEVVTSQQVEGTPATAVVFLEVPQAVRQQFHGQVVFTPFAVDGRGAFSPAEVPGQTVWDPERLTGGLPPPAWGWGPWGCMSPQPEKKGGLSVPVRGGGAAGSQANGAGPGRIGAGSTSCHRGAGTGLALGGGGPARL